MKLFRGIAPHFGLWRYLYHCKPGMANCKHQVVGGTSLELCRGRKEEYLDIPLKDNIKGWRYEWFTMENHNNSLPALSRRHPHMWVPRWIEGPIDSEISEARALLNEIANLKDRVLTIEVVVIDFVFNNIQPLKDRLHPAYLYAIATDPSCVTERLVTKQNVLHPAKMMLRVAIVNDGGPQAYSTWNLPPM
jgi:hypothetical protein